VKIVGTEGSLLAHNRLHLPFFLSLLVVLAVPGLLMTLAAVDTEKNETEAHDVQRADGLAAWERVYAVLTSPRCINCHTATNYPQQGDDRHRHFANVIRGPEGKGVPGLNCVSCHQASNADSTGVPGGLNWHLAPLSMRWQDLNDRPLSSAAVCRAVTDGSRNHALDGPGLLKHHQEEPLVLWAWNPGRRLDGTMRSVPPTTHADFVAATRQWVQAGTPCPPGK
jgi:mono/diheme cytochrome c family protein